MSLDKVSFSRLVFLCLAIQYALMHWFSSGEAIVITSIELIIYIAYTFVSLVLFFYKSRRVNIEAFTGMFSLFFSVVWTVALISQFHKESYPDALTVINSVGIFTAILMLFVEFIKLARA